MKTIRMKTLILWLVLLLVPALAQKYGVYRYAVVNAQDEYDTIIENLTASAEENGLSVIATVPMGVPEECQYRSTVLVLVDSAYAAKLTAVNAQTAPYAMTDRVNVFQDEAGTHVSFLNPNSVIRTFLMDDKAYQDLSRVHTEKLKAWIQSAVKGTASDKEYGQQRKKGYISRTMGVMAGGKFADKINTIFELENKSLAEVAEKVENGLSVTGKDLGMHGVYRLEIPEINAVLFGVSGTPMDSKSFSIVGAGADKERKKFSCPGIAHAAAYPIEVVVRQNGKNVQVEMVDAMFRMKIFFEDAGKWAFMKNMGMPGAIADEIKGLIEAKLN